ncbi:EAL domain-containing protein [Fervidibacillus halotolerans]|uniref:EAL domain-containing protein n=1 Tax=Fervidibacillus halotolerans TaxID=2980027 RepID=A0A9E8M234_9BACI|nr:EAL domain-containing protein [Fervidibacillus halotolerans]WAA13849.1 EAL domain-containing protein [Fervidibacillus halotolerans]
MIEKIIRDYTYTNVFQPIYRLDTIDIIGYESLFRSEMASPETLFRLAHMTNEVFELDLLSMKNSIEIFTDYCPASHTLELNLFLNVFPSTLTNNRFVKFLNQMEEAYRNVLGEIVFEINEAENTEDIHQLKIITKQLKDKGYKIALDDLGSGYSSLKMLFELEPNLVKIDKYFARGLHKDQKKQDLLKLFASFAKDDVDIVLEGIEYKEDLQAAQSIGIDLGQGYLLGKPSPLGNMLSIVNQK